MNSNATSLKPNTTANAEDKKTLKSLLHSTWLKYKPLIAAKDSLDDEYNFSSGTRSSWGGQPYNFPAVKRRGVEDE